MSILIFILNMNIFAHGGIYGIITKPLEKMHTSSCLMWSVVSDGIEDCTVNLVKHGENNFLFLTAKHCIYNDAYLNFISCGKSVPITLNLNNMSLIQDEDIKDNLSILLGGNIASRY